MVGKFLNSKMERERHARSMNMMRLRAAVVLLRVIEIQDYLLARRVRATKENDVATETVRPS
jgi:hypothetical protein